MNRSELFEAWLQTKDGKDIPLNDEASSDELIQKAITSRKRARDDLVQINHEIFAVAFLRGDMPTAESALAEILHMQKESM